MKNKMGSLTRITIFLIGLLMSIAILVYSINWEKLPIQVVFINQNITIYAFAGFIVLFGIFAHTLIKSAMLGKWRMD